MPTPPPVINTASPLPNGMTLVSYSTPIIASINIYVPYTWNIPVGTLPFDLSISSSNATSAVISGIPQIAGTYNFVVRATDSRGGGMNVTKPFSLTIDNPVLPPEDWSSSGSSSSLSSLSSDSSSSSSNSSNSSDSSNSSLRYSSSSSTSYPWEFAKPLIFGHSATDNETIRNRIAQVISIKETSIAIKKAYCYLYGPYQNNNTAPFNIYLGIYQCSNDGKPLTLITETSILSSVITGDGWYEFDFSLVSFSITNTYVAFVMRQEYGGENDYSLWGYTNTIDYENISSKAFVSNDSTNWQEINNTCFGIKIIESAQSLFDLDNGTVVTEPATPISLPINLSDLQNSSNSGTTTIVEYEGTRLIDDPNNPRSSIVEIEGKNLFVSFVLDKSGSMGWLDRFKKRISFTSSFIENLSNNYNANILYDMVGFGAVQLNPNSLTQEGTLARINLDARNPTRCPYIFTAKNSANVFISDIYSQNNNQYIVSNNSNGIIITCSGMADPISSGTLVKVSGSGDPYIEFSSYNKISVDNEQIVAFGFKNLYPNKVYNISTIQIDDNDIVDPTSKFWQMLVPNWQTYPIGQYPTMTIGENGPYADSTLDITMPSITSPELKSQTIIRNPYYPVAAVIATANVVSNVPAGATTVTVSNSNSFSIGTRIDIVDGFNIEYAHTISNISGSIITFNPPTTNAIYDSNTYGGIVQKSTFYTQPMQFNGTTISLLVRDQTVSNTSVNNQMITLFLQTYDDYMIEWDFLPYKEWSKPLLYWLGDTATFTFDLIDSEGNSLPDGTEIDLAVKDKISSSNASSNSSSITTPITTLANVGDTTIYVSELTGLAKDQNILISDNIYSQSETIMSVGVDLDGLNYIDLYEPLQFEFSPDRGANITISSGTTAKQEDVEAFMEDPNKIISLSLPYVDITPMYTGVEIDPSLLLPSDPPQISPTTTYQDINYDEVRTRSETYNGPSNNGKAVIRILPITEDVLKTNAEKNNNPQLISTISTKVTTSNQIPMNSSDVVTSPFTVTKENQIFIGSDYTIGTPVFLYDGTASSDMVSYATSLTVNHIPGIRQPMPNSKIINDPLTGDRSGVASLPQTSYSDMSDQVFSKKYTINPSVKLTFKNNYNSFVQYTSPFDVYFAPRYYINSGGDGQMISGSTLPDVGINKEGESEIGSPKIINRPGIYSTSANTYSVTFTTTDKFTLLQNGTLVLRVFVNPMVNCEDVEPILTDYVTDPPYKPETLASLQLIKGFVINITNKNSALDTWRSTVEKNDLNTILTNLLTSLSDSQPITSAPDVPSGAAKILNTDNWALIAQENIPINNGTSTYTMGSLPYPGLVMLDVSYSFGNGLFESVKKEYFYMANPLLFRFFSTYAFRPKLGNSYDIGGRVAWMNNAYGTIQDGTVVSIRGVRDSVAPSISETIDGRADGMIIQPLPWVFDNSDDPLLPDPPGIPSMIGD